MRCLLRLLVILTAALSLAVATAASAASTPELSLARSDAQRIVAAYVGLADGAPLGLCRLMSSGALRGLGGITRCGQTLGDPAALRTKIALSNTQVVTEAYHLRHLKILSLKLKSEGGKRYATVVLLPKLDSGYWQWVLLKENGHYRLFKDIG